MKGVTHTILYQQSHVWADEYDEVSVTVERWTSPRANRIMYEAAVTVAGTQTVYTLKAESGYGVTDAKAQRIGIACFDRLLANHPCNHNDSPGDSHS